MLGPFNLSINGDIGVLIEGFEAPPVFLTGHGRPYYDARVQELGYHKAKDVVAYRLDPTVTPPRVMAECARRARESARVRIRPLDKSRHEGGGGDHQRHLQRCVGDHWSFVPFTEAEFAELASALKYLVPVQLVQFAEVDGEPAAMLVIVPNLNELIGDLRGRLLLQRHRQLFLVVLLIDQLAGQVVGIRLHVEEAVAAEVEEDAFVSRLSRGSGWPR